MYDVLMCDKYDKFVQKIVAKYYEGIMVFGSVFFRTLVLGTQQFGTLEIPCKFFHSNMICQTR